MFNLKITNNLLPLSNKTKLLGFIINEKLTWNVHI